MNDKPIIPPSEGLSAAENVIDIGLWFENRERYIAQSLATQVNRRAELPPRERLGSA